MNHDFTLLPVEIRTPLDDTEFYELLADWQGIELLPLFKRKLSRLLLDGVESINLGSDRVLRVVLSGDAASRFPREQCLPIESRSIDFVLFVYCDLSLMRLPDSDFISEWTSGALKASHELLEWLVRSCIEPQRALSLGLVGEEALPLLTDLARAYQSAQFTHK